MVEYKCRRAKYFKVKAEDFDSAEEKAAEVTLNEVKPKTTVREEGIIQNDIIRQATADILDEIEELLAKYDIYIPDNNREGEEDEAHLFGENYYKLEDTIVDLLTERMW